MTRTLGGSPVEVRKVWVSRNLASDIRHALHKDPEKEQDEVAVLVDDRGKTVGVVVSVEEFNLNKKLTSIAEDQNSVYRFLGQMHSGASGLTFDDVFGDKQK